MQYAIMSGRTPELLAGITFYSIYSHLNWVETLMRQWCTAIESCLPPGWPPQAAQMWSKREKAGTLRLVKGLKKSDRNAHAVLLPAFYLSPHGSSGRGDGQLNDRHWCRIQAQRRAEATHVETCVQTCTNSHGFILSGWSCTACMLTRTLCS